MKQDIIPISQQRGSIRPPARPSVVASRPVQARQPVRNPVSMDGMKSVSGAHKSLLTIQPTKPVQSFQDVQQVRRPVQLAPIEPTAQVSPFAKVSAPVSAPVKSQVPSLVAAPIQAQSPVQTNPVIAPKLDINEVENTQIETEPSTLQKHTQETHSKKPKKRFDFKKHGLISLAVIVLLVTAYISVDTWLTNRQAQAIATGADSTATTTGAPVKENEGKDETPVNAETLANYTVAAEYPRALYIDKLNVAARVLPMSINTDGSVQSPVNIFDAGWYTGSVKPGEIGAAFIDGHASGATRQGLFGKLDTLVVGDTLEVEKGDGSKLAYKVVHTETVPLEGLDMKKVLLPHGNSLKALNIMTCTGEWLDDKQTFDHRVIVYTELVQ